MKNKYHIKGLPITLAEYLQNEMMKGNKWQKDDKLDDLINKFLMTESGDKEHQTIRDRQHLTTITNKQQQKCNQQEHQTNDPNMDHMEPNRPKLMQNNVIRMRQNESAEDQVGKAMNDNHT